ncbi:MAG TPA: DUF4197 domain-containing protein [Burkholderiaceae bacterium]|jgi:hypothetical protein|nr:DUF4197 domain-containing protein [Burkholderiaceae bacterium]
MKRRIFIFASVQASGMALAQVPDLDKLMKSVPKVPAATGATAGSSDAKTDIAGIKEALAIGTEKAVNSLSKTDGYFGDKAVKILMPKNIQKVAEMARMAGYEKQVDEFVLSMNRAAEAAVPVAARIFGDAIRGMTVDDVRAILTGGDTAATEFFKRTSEKKLYAAFKPVVSKKVDEVGTTRAYKEMMGRYEQVPLMQSKSLDLDDYVTRKALDGVFYMVGQEEKQIRTNPAARTTDLLKSVFGK